MMIPNILFSRSQNGVCLGYAPNGRKVYVDVFNTPNVGIIDDQYDRLWANVNDFANSLLELGCFSVVSVENELNVNPSPDYMRVDISKAREYYRELKEEIERRMFLFDQCDVNNIDEYNCKQENALKRIAVFVCIEDSEAMGDRADFRWISVMSKAFGIFMCYYSTRDNVRRALYAFEEANYIEFEKIKTTLQDDPLFYGVIDFAIEEKAINTPALIKRFGITEKEAIYYMDVLTTLGFVSAKRYCRVLLDSQSKCRELDKAKSFMDIAWDLEDLVISN